MRISDWSSDGCASDLHLHREGLVADDHVEPALTGEGRRCHSLGQRRYHGAVDSVRDASLRYIDAVAQPAEGRAHVVGAQLVWIPDAWPEGRIGVDKAYEPAVDRMHGAIGRIAGPGPFRIGQVRLRWLARCERMPAFQGSILFVLDCDG